MTSFGGYFRKDMIFSKRGLGKCKAVRGSEGDKK